MANNNNNTHKTDAEINAMTTDERMKYLASIANTNTAGNNDDAWRNSR